MSRFPRIAFACLAGLAVCAAWAATSFVVDLHYGQLAPDDVGRLGGVLYGLPAGLAATLLAGWAVLALGRIGRAAPVALVGWTLTLLLTVALAVVTVDSRPLGPDERIWPDVARALVPVAAYVLAAVMIPARAAGSRTPSAQPAP
ncbi:hypothetical protein [Longispora albida]|uniref:hypothetical protein n=1 Tax=Longispora albida TaxID=203523 RepID=UPI0003747A0B|nr:hypothetical protein [Longispora albida]